MRGWRDLGGLSRALGVVMESLGSLGQGPPQGLASQGEPSWREGIQPDSESGVGVLGESPGPSGPRFHHLECWSVQ